MDPSLNPAKRTLLLESAQIVANDRLRLSEQASEEGDAIEATREKSTMMPRRIERVKTGSLFFWELSCTIMTELERDTFNTMTMAFLSNAVVGGKSGTGHGKIRAISARQLELTRPRDAAGDLSVTDLVPRVGNLFRAHVADRAMRIAEFLGKVEA